MCQFLQNILHTHGVLGFWGFGVLVWFVTVWYGLEWFGVVLVWFGVV